MVLAILLVIFFAAFLWLLSDHLADEG